MTRRLNVENEPADIALPPYPGLGVWGGGGGGKGHFTKKKFFHVIFFFFKKKEEVY